MPEEVLVVKLGGTDGVDIAGSCEVIAEAARDGRQAVVVHGGSGEAARLAARLGVPLRQLTAPDGTTTRYADAAAMEVLQLAWTGRVKPSLLVELARHGQPAVGLTGLDAGLLRARRHPVQRTVADGRVRLVRDDNNGRIVSVGAGVLHTLLAAGLVPVVSPPALGCDGRPVNVDADRVAAAIAVAVHATDLLLLTSAPGVLARPADASSVLAAYTLPPAGQRDQFVRGGMAVKLAAARAALNGGVPHVRVADGRSAAEVRRALAGVGGTRIRLTDVQEAQR
jgi:acetylglutamate/LysW-gamma-L-alpha-aminoadipate kinase